MKIVVKQLNVHFRFHNQNVTWSFQTVYDDVVGIKRYVVVCSNGMHEMAKEDGNKLFRFLKEHFECKTVLIIDKEENKVTYNKAMEHYEVRVGGKFVESCDNVIELREALERWKEATASV